MRATLGDLVQKLGELRCLHHGGIHEQRHVGRRRVGLERREHGETSPRKMGGRRTVKIERKRLRELVAERPDATLNELRDALGVECGISAVWAALKAMGLSFKKRRSMPPNRTAPMLPSDERTGKQGKGSSTQAA